MAKRAEAIGATSARDERSIGDLFAELSEKTSTLVKKEIELARHEVTRSATEMARKSAMIGVGGAIAYAGFIVLLIGAAWLLALSVFRLGSLSRSPAGSRWPWARSSQCALRSRSRAVSVVPEGPLKRSSRTSNGQRNRRNDRNVRGGRRMAADTDPESERLASEIEETRSEMAGTIDQIGHRLQPQTIANEAREKVREATVGKVERMVGDAGQSVQRTSNGMIDTIRQNPVPAALAALGIGWLAVRMRDQNSTGYGRSSRDYGQRFANGYRLPMGIRAMARTRCSGRGVRLRMLRTRQHSVRNKLGLMFSARPRTPSTEPPNGSRRPNGRSIEPGTTTRWRLAPSPWAWAQRWRWPSPKHRRNTNCSGSSVIGWSRRWARPRPRRWTRRNPRPRSSPDRRPMVQTDIPAGSNSDSQPVYTAYPTDQS